MHARCVSLTSSTTPPTTSWSVPRPSSRWDFYLKTQKDKPNLKGAIVTIDSTPFRQWYEAHYAKALGRKKNAKLTEEEQKTISGPRSANSQKKIDERRKEAEVAVSLTEQFGQGRLLARIASRPGTIKTNQRIFSNLIFSSQARPVAATATSWRARSSTSTFASWRPRRRNRFSVSVFTQ